MTDAAIKQFTEESLAKELWIAISPKGQIWTTPVLSELVDLLKATSDEIEANKK
jgi:hypothetical protein